MMNDFAKVLAGSRWLLDARQFRTMVERIATASPDAVKAAVEAYAQRAQTPTMIGDIAVIQCCGPITYRNSFFSMWYGSSTIEGMQQQFRTALNDPAVRTILFRVDSPGGSSEMVPEFADEIFAARGQKPMVAVADTMMCSAAFWLFSQVDTIYGPRSSGAIGSVGAYLQHEEISGMLERLGIKVTLIKYGENKAMANDVEPLSEAAEAYLQAEVNECGAEFDAAAARGRNVTSKVVRDTFGQGLVFSGIKAKKLGMIDQIGTFDAVMAKLTGSKKRASVQVSETAHIEGDTLVITEPVNAADITVTAELATTKKSDAIDPDEDGNCPDGYEKRDGMCHPIESDEKAAATDPVPSTAARDAALIAITLSE